MPTRLFSSSMSRIFRFMCIFFTYGSHFLHAFAGVDRIRPGGSAAGQCAARRIENRSVGVDEYVDPWREAPSAPPLGELLSEREAEGVRLVS